MAVEKCLEIISEQVSHEGGFESGRRSRVFEAKQMGQRKKHSFIKCFCDYANGNKDIVSCYLTGNRDVVGWGFNGTASYVDREEFPMPAVRFKENTPDVMALREKEKNDWKCLTLEEKKACGWLFCLSIMFPSLTSAVIQLN